MPHLRVHGPDGPVSTLDLLGLGLTVFTGPDGGRWQVPEAVATDRVPVTTHRVDGIAARALGIPAGGALVVRPDGAPAEPAARAEVSAAA
jgi:hypothetical protein